LCGQALTVLEALDRFTEVANGELLSPPIKILSFPRLADTLLAPAIADTIRAAPHARFKVELRSRRELGQGRSRDSHDAIIMTMLSPAHEHPDKIGRVPLFAVMHRHHALSRRTRLKVADLDGHGVIQLEHGTLMRHIADELFALEGIDPLTLVETSSSPHALQLAASGVGIFIVDGLYPAPFSPSLSVIPLDCRNQSIDVVIKRPAGSNELPALDLLIGNVSARMQAHLDRLPEAA
ncbi:MAG: LysR substrate-binding domain-containing protein, partial [Geminicoccaceae bacterium]